MTSDKVISFDLDGTLIFGPFGRVLTDLGAELATGAESPGAKRAILDRHKELLTTDVLAAYDWEGIVDAYVGALGVDAPFDLLERLDSYVTGGTRIIHNDTPELLARLRRRGWRVVVLTNGWRRYQVPVLRGVGLLDAVDALITSDDVGAPKPATCMFAAARNGAGDYVHVGDRIDHDVAGGNLVGARTVLLRDDVPVHGHGSTADPGVVDYLRRLANEDGVLAPGVPSDLVPDLFAANLREVVEWVVS